MIQDARNSFLHTRDGRIFTFKTFRKILELPSFNVKFFNCFGNSCYVLIQQTGTALKLSIYPSFGEEYDISSCEMDLDYPRNPVTIGGARDNELICVEMIQGPLKAKTVLFLSELLACNLKDENIVDVLLISIDDKLMWIKYKNSFHESAIDGYSIETVTIAKGVIRGIKHCENFLMMIDDLSMLTVFHLCRTTQIIKKTEILLDGIVHCFRFHLNTFIYSNLEQIIFIDINQFAQPARRTVNLKGITCFSNVAGHNFMLAVCRNRMFYYVPMKALQKQMITNNDEDFMELGTADIEAIPFVAKFLETEEKNLILIEQEIIKAQKLKLLMQHLISNKNFTAGDAIIKFHRDYPLLTENAIVCKVNQHSGLGFIEINITFAKILTALSFNIAFNRHGASGVITRTIKIDCANESSCIILPAETDNDATSKKSLELTLNHNIKGKTILMTYPINIKEVVALKKAIVGPKDSLDDCLEIVNKRQM